MATNRPSLQEILQFKNFPPELLDQPCQDKPLSKVAKQITKWPLLAPFLEISKAEENEILEDWPKNTAKQKIDVLRKWKQKHGHKATYRRLLEAICKADEVSLAEKVCDIVNSQDSSTSESSEDESVIPPTTKKPKVVYSLDTHIDYLRDMYGRIRPQFLVLQWPPPPTRKVFNLAMIKNRNVQCGPVDEELVRLLQRGDVCEFVKGKISVQLQNLFQLDDEDRKIILIEGAPGSGKSTLAWHSCQQWKAGELFLEFKMVVFVQLRDPRVQSAKSIADLLPVGPEKRRRDAAEGIKACEGRKVLFVLDGWDEYSPGLDTDSIVRKLICNPEELEVLYSSLIITSRPIASAVLQPHASSRVEIVGFTQEEVGQYFQEVVNHPEAVKSLQEKLETLPVIKASCYLPLNAAIVAHLFLGLNHTLPCTLYGVFLELVCGCIIRYLTKKSGKQGHIPEIRSLDKLPCEVQAHFDNLCVLAYEASMRNKTTFSSEDLSFYGVSVEGNGLGLMQGVQSFLSGKSDSYHFLHLSVQELLAAVHVSNLAAAKQVSVFHKLFSDTRLVAVFRFFAALTKLETVGMREVVKSVTVDSKPGSGSSKDEQRQWRQGVLNILRCLYEAQDVDLCLFVASLLGSAKGNYNLDLVELSLSPLDCLCLGYFLCYVCVGREGEFAVDLTNCGLDSYSVGFLVKELGKYPGVSVNSDSSNAVIGCLELRLSSNNISGSGVRLLCGLMNNPGIIKKLSLSGNNKIRDGEDGLLHVLCRYHSLVEVNVIACDMKINNETGPVLVEKLHKNDNLKGLALGYNPINDIGMGYVAEGMIGNSEIVKLRLESLLMGAGRVKALQLGRMLTGNKTLKLLNLYGNWDLGDVGLMEVSKAMKINSTLEALNIYGCGYSLDGLKGFVLSLKENSHLRRLGVDERNKEAELLVEERAAVNDLRRQRGEVELEVVDGASVNSEEWF